MNRDQKKAIWLSLVAVGVSVASVVISVIIVTQAKYQAQQKVTVAEVDSLVKTANLQFRLSRQNLQALLEALQAAQQLKQLDKSFWTEDYRKNKVIISLLKAIDNIREKNTIDIGSDVYRYYLQAQTIAVPNSDTVKLFDGQTGRKIITLPIPESREIAISPDGQIVAIGTEINSTIQLRKRDGTLVKTIPNHDGKIRDLTFSPDGQIIAGVLAHGSTQDTVRLWKKDGTILQTFTEQLYPVISFSPDGKILAIEKSNANNKQERILQLWKLDGTLVKTFVKPNYSGKGLKYKPENVDYRWFHTDRDIGFSPDGQLIASASFDGTLKVWDLKGKSTILAGHEDVITDFDISPDSQTIATASNDRTVKLWKRDGTLVKTIRGHCSGVSSVQFSPDGQVIVSASRDKTIKLWRSNGIAINSLEGHSESVNYVTFSPDGQNILSSSSEDRVIKFWQWKGLPPPILTGHTEEVESVSFSPDSQTIATASKDGTVKLWQREGKLLKTLVVAQGSIYRSPSVSFSPDGQTIVTANSKDYTEDGGNYGLRFWKRDGTLINKLEISYPSVVEYSPNGQFIAVAVPSGEIKLRKQDGSLIATLTGHSFSITDIKFSPDGQTIITASYDHTVRLWKYDGTLIRTLTGHQDKVNSISISSDGQTIASASRDETVKLWQPDGTLLKTFITDNTSVQSVSLSPDGQMIATVDYHQLKLWTRDGTLLAKSHKTGEYNSVNFSPDGEILAVAGKDGRVTLLNLQLDHLTELGCNWIEDYLATHPKEQQKMKICQAH